MGADMTNAPTISVIMPAYNAASYVGEAIASILAQTFADFELIIVDDGSTDTTDEVIRSFRDLRIRHLTQTNQGISAALNNGIAQARGELIARMDADDVSLPERFAKQVAFLRNNKSIGLVGTWATIMSETGAPVGALEHPTDDERIRYALLFDTPFVHPSMMMRRELFAIVGGYDGAPSIFEDFNLWSRMVPHTRGANIPEHLLRYRLVGTSLSHIGNARSERVLEQRRRNLRIIFPAVPQELLDSVSEHGLRHRRIPISHFLPVRALLARHIRGTVRTPTSARQLQAGMRNAMLGYRIIEHRNLLYRLVDRALKEALLITSDLFTAGIRRERLSPHDLRRQ